MAVAPNRPWVADPTYVSTWIGFLRRRDLMVESGAGQDRLRGRDLSTAHRLTVAATIVAEVWDVSRFGRPAAPVSSATSHDPPVGPTRPRCPPIELRGQRPPRMSQRRSGRPVRQLPTPRNRARWPGVRP